MVENIMGDQTAYTDGNPGPGRVGIYMYVKMG